MIREEDVFKIGILGKTHGVKGELNMVIDDDVFDRVDADYLVLKIDGIMVPFFIEEYRFRSDDQVLIKFCDVDSAERAKDMTGIEVFFPYCLADRNREEMMKWTDFVGYTIDRVGEIVSVDDTTENILFEAVNSHDGKHVLIPAAGEWIKEIKDKKIIMDIPKGLLDL